mmetsp:Transcript_24073/g.69236  ORF Transcript_24073/g.69236 Transcript_24073/m.69236 type:complete len:310 (-) Transcript_24073:353-1282(-)
MALKLALFFALTAATSAARSEAARTRKDVEYTLDTYYSVPDLDVVYTTNMRPALKVLNAWARERDRDFGLFIQTKPTQGLFYPRRISMIGISRGHRVLLFDLKPYLRPWPQPLPDFLEDFLEHENHTFYGMGLMDTAARLAFEFDCVIRCVDYRIRSWPRMQLGGGLYGLVARHLRMPIARPETLRALSSQLVHTHLQWAVFDYFSRLSGDPDPSWLITKAEMFGVGPVYLRVAGAKHDWSSARLEWMHSMHNQQSNRAALQRALGSLRRRDQGGRHEGDRDLEEEEQEQGGGSEEWEVEGNDVFTHAV